MKRMWSKNELKQQNNANAIELLGSGQVPSIKGDEIIENMSGYSVSLPSTDEHREVNPIYVGICKNGNKLTLVVFMALVPLEENLSGANCAVPTTFTIPEEVGSKLYTYLVGGYPYLENKSCQATQYDDFTRHDIDVDILKDSNTQFRVVAYVPTTAGNLTANKTYVLRIEQTFLLSENLVPSE